MGAEVVLDQPDPLPARGIFNIWPFVAKAFLVELNLSIFNPVGLLAHCLCTFV